MLQKLNETPTELFSIKNQHLIQLRLFITAISYFHHQGKSNDILFKKFKILNMNCLLLFFVFTLKEWIY